MERQKTKYPIDQELEGEDAVPRRNLLHIQSSRRVYEHADIHDPEAYHLRGEALKVLGDVIDKELTEREKRFIYLRYFEQRSMKEIALEFGRSRTRIDQIEWRAIHKLRRQSAVLHALDIPLDYNFDKTHISEGDSLTDERSAVKGTIDSSSGAEMNATSETTVKWMFWVVVMSRLKAWYESLYYP
jgi:hypothetical protein